MLLAAALIPAKGQSARAFDVQISGHGKPVVLIPGLACSGEVWTETVQHLNAEGYQTYTLTLAGFGGTTPIHADEYLPTVRKDLVAYIQEQHLEKPVIIGHSLGGFLALWLAATNPDVPGKVISVDGLPFLAGVMQPGTTDEQAKQMAAQIRNGMAQAGPAQYEEQAKMSLHSMITSDASFERELKVDLSSDRATVAQAMGELLSTDIRPDMSKIKCPVEVLGSWIAYKQYGATHDGAAKLYESQFNGNAHISVAMCDTSKHFIQLDDPAWFYAHVDAFLKD